MASRPVVGLGMAPRRHQRQPCVRCSCDGNRSSVGRVGPFAIPSTRDSRSREIASSKQSADRGPRGPLTTYQGRASEAHSNGHLWGTVPSWCYLGRSGIRAAPDARRPRGRYLATRFDRGHEQVEHDVHGRPVAVVPHRSPDDAGGDTSCARRAHCFRGPHAAPATNRWDRGCRRARA